MKCDTHPQSDAVGTCSSCGKAICEECRSDIGGKNYCDDCLEAEVGPGDADATLKRKGEYLWPVIAVVAVFLPWMTIRFGFTQRGISGVNTDIGVLYLFGALGAIVVLWKWDGKKKRRGLIGFGVLMAVFAVASLYYMIIRIAQSEQALEGNPFAELIGVDIGIGLYLAFLTSVVIIYKGYQTGISVEGVGFSLPRSTKYALMGVNAILALLFGVFTAGVAISGQVLQFIAYLLTFAVFAGITYFVFRSSSRKRVVQFGFVGIFGALLGSIAGVENMASGGNMAIPFTIFVILPILVLASDLWFMQQMSDGRQSAEIKGEATS